MQFQERHLDLVRQSVSRFWAKVDVPFAPNGCWTWSGGRNGDGYGTFLLTLAPKKYTAVGAHRLAYEALVGPIPKGKELDHLCRNRQCVRPDHLDPVDHRTNILRGEGVAARQARKTTCIRGHEFDAQRGRWRLCSTCARTRHAKVA